MNFKFQEDAYNQIDNLIESDVHTILLEGPKGSGKTYIANQFKNKSNVDALINVSCSVDELRSTMNESFDTDNNVLFVLENLDEVTVKSSYTLLKFIEEPRSNIFIIITCRNLYGVPDTILSRSSIVNLGHPNESDLISYCNNKDTVKSKELQTLKIWKIVNSFSDIDDILKLPLDKLKYFDNFELAIFKDTVSNLIWQFSHYPDNTETNLDFVIRYMLCNTDNQHIKFNCIESLKALQKKRVSQFAILSKFLFECKYGSEMR